MCAIMQLAQRKGERLVERYLSIGEMAEIHNLTRQTLIYYDKIGLFKPAYVDENGYRYYSSYQIPFLREICFFKAAGIKLEDIKNHINKRDLQTAISLLEYHKRFIDKEIERLMSIRESIANRLAIYEKASNFQEELSKPIIETFPERHVVFLPYNGELKKQVLHLTIMQIWNALSKHEIMPSAGFGTIIKKESLCKENILEGAGAYVAIPARTEHIEQIANVMTLPAGEYVCMYKYGMPYDTHFLYNLLSWVKENHYQVAGDIVDACILDTTFYDKDTEVDLCQLQIPIKK